MNDAADVAALLGADGLHVGQKDLPAEAARRLVGPDALLGDSVSILDQAREAARRAEVDYLGVGAIFPTTTKANAEYRGLELLRNVRAAVDLPLVAIGGITVEHAPDVWRAGADLIAVVTAVFSSSEPGAAARAFLASAPSQTGPY